MATAMLETAWKAGEEHVTYVATIDGGAARRAVEPEAAAMVRDLAASGVAFRVIRGRLGGFQSYKEMARMLARLGVDASELAYVTADTRPGHHEPIADDEAAADIAGRM